MNNEIMTMNGKLLDGPGENDKQEESKIEKNVEVE